jgi:hypothetical protein
LTETGTECGSRARRRSLSGAAVAGLVAWFTLAACASSPTDTVTGTALVRGTVMFFGLAPIRPGTQLGLLYASVKNKSTSPLTINSISLAGPGVGTVIKLVEVKIAPLETGRKGTPGGAYEVYPPTAYWPPTDSCNQQVLVALPIRLRPREEARVWFRIQGARPGPFHVKDDVVRYRQDGTNYRQLIPTGYKGSVSRHARFIPIDVQQARCMKSEHARPLRGHYLTKPKNWTS